MSNKLSDAQIEEILEMAGGGVSVELIAEEVGVNSQTIYKLLRTRGIARKKARKIDLSQEKIDDIEERYSNTGESVAAIIRDYRISYNTFYRLLREHDIPVRKMMEEYKSAEALRMDTAIKLYERGFPIWNIEQETGIRHPRLHKESRLRGIIFRKEVTKTNILENDLP